MNKIKEFIRRWQNKGREKQDTQTFWIELLADVLDIDDATKRINFEKTVEIKGNDGKFHTKFIDAYIPETKVLIEQKDSKLSLNKAYSMSGTDRKYTPYEQGDRYGRHMNHDEHPRYIIACNFREIEIHDNNKRREEPLVIKLKDLEKDYPKLKFLINKNIHIEKEKEISVQAGRLVGRIYEALHRMYKNPEDDEILKSLNVLIVRLVFILYAEDSGIFAKQQFVDYMEQFRDNPGVFRRELLALFEILDTPYDERDPYLEEDLLKFPYVNGGLFSKDIKITVPAFNEEVINLILREAASGFDWKGISPTIFGATFESTLNPETRRAGGMHYTSLENIHKVIDPLFLDELKEEFKKIEKNQNIGSRTVSLNRFRDKLASLNFFDPACGSGNFLTETYLELRRLENKALSLLNKGQAMFVDVNLSDPIKVSLDQFYGIEINDFAVAVANTALFISEYQMLKETEAILNRPIEYLPLHSFDGIHEGNALRMDWNEVIPAEKCNYIMGNPPFLGKKEQSKKQKKDLLNAFNKVNVGNLDYITGWYAKAVKMMEQNKNIFCAFVSTNSITQGEQVPLLWDYLLGTGVCINFAYQSFVWNNEVKNSAAVHCVIIGFSLINSKNKTLFSSKNQELKVSNINPYLLEAPNIIIKHRKKPLISSSLIPQMRYGSMPIDNGYLILNEKDVEKLLNENNNNQKYIRKFIGGKELLNNQQRWCLWLVDADLSELRKSEFISDRIKKNREFRSSSKRQATVKLADTPTLFGEIRQPDSEMLVIPKVSSENREYVPISYISPEVIVNGSALVLPNANYYNFGILTSNIHNIWMRTVAGRMKSDYQYSESIVYNNFPWPNPTEKQKENIEKSALAILKARDLFPKSSLADLYDQNFMPVKLRKAHEANDKAVMDAYGFDLNMSENEIVTELMKLYSELTK